MSPVEELAGTIHSALERLGIYQIAKGTVVEVLRVVYAASMRTEEGRFIKCSVTFADPENPDAEGPHISSAHRPRFTKFEQPVTYNAERIIKLSRAIDHWAGSLAVHGSAASGLEIWGFADQRVHFNLKLNAEPKGHSQPGLFTVVVDGVGQIAAYNGLFFLGGMRYEEVYTTQPDIIASHFIETMIAPSLKGVIDDISDNLPLSVDHARVELEYLNLWRDTVRRLCIGIQRAGTGGAIIISPKLKRSVLKDGFRVDYGRLKEAMTFQTLYKLYSDELSYSAVTRKDFEDYQDAAFDADDRQQELTGAIRLVSSMATLDGALVLHSDLVVERFGAKIESKAEIDTVFDGMRAILGRKTARQVEYDFRKHGMRHKSALQYCKEDGESIVFIISQDGAVRLASSHGGSLIMCDNLRIRQYITDAKYWREVLEVQELKGYAVTGYSELAQNLGDLAKAAKVRRNAPAVTNKRK